MKHGGDTMRAVKKRLGELTTDEVVALMAAHEVPCAPVVGLEQVHRHPQVVASGVLEETVHPVLGRMRQPRPAARFSGDADGSLAPRRPAPAAGEHTDEILEEAGFSAAERSELRDSGVVA
jgi:crotonobetainyl-CoA:carnitine CoA-transferase CaiB-like acyl-CoA transferase